MVMVKTLASPNHRYLTVREQKLMERKKQASELLRWKRDLDAEEEKVLQLERTALQAWEGRVSDKPSATRGAGAADKKKERDAKREETEKKGDCCGYILMAPCVGKSWCMLVPWPISRALFATKLSVLMYPYKITSESANKVGAYICNVCADSITVTYII